MAAQLRSVVFLAACLAAVPAVAPVRQRHLKVVDFTSPPHDWPQFDRNAQHSGSANDDMITPQNVGNLQPLFRSKLPAPADGSPAYWTAGSDRRSRHVLFFTATNGSLIAIRANGELLWQTSAPPGPRWTTSSPVLDPSRQFVYSYALDGRVHKYAIGDGSEVVDGIWPVLVTRKPDVEKGSSALTVATRPDGTSYLYATVAGYPDPGDAGDYQGHIVAIRLQDGDTTIFNALCSRTPHLLGPGDCHAVRAGLWARGGVDYDEASDSVFVVTSNGPYNGKTRWGDSILRLPPDLRVDKGQPLDAYTPDEHAWLADNDLDLGSSGMAIAREFGIVVGKDAVVRLVNLHDLSGYNAAGSTGGEVQRVTLPQGGEVLTAPAVWTDSAGRAWIFVANDNGTSAFELVDGALAERWTNAETSRSSPVVVNGVLFAAENGRIYALDAQTGTELWSGPLIGDIHWESPVVANGAVYMSDLDGNVYGWALPPTVTLH